MERILVMTDVHGELYKFNQLLDKVKYNPKKDKLIIMGDYVDRGLNSKGVIDKVMRLKKENSNVVLLKGNHDELFVNGVKSNLRDANIWLNHGGIEALQSYGIDCLSTYDLKILYGNVFYIIDFLREKINIPEIKNKLNEHANFLHSLPMYYEYEDYIFSHAGININKPLIEQNNRDLLWGDNFQDFYNNYNENKIIIFGHVTADKLHGDHNIYFGNNNIIGVDGGSVFYGGQLNCLILPTKESVIIK